MFFCKGVAEIGLSCRVFWLSRCFIGGHRTRQFAAIGARRMREGEREMKNNFFSLGGSLVFVIAICLAIDAGRGHAGVCIVAGMATFVALAWAALAASTAGGRQRSMLLGMPAPLVGAFVVASLAIANLLNAGGGSTVQAFAWSAGAGLLMAICHWYFYARQAYKCQ